MEELPPAEITKNCHVQLRSQTFSSEILKNYHEHLWSENGPGRNSAELLHQLLGKSRFLGRPDTIIVKRTKRHAALRVLQVQHLSPPRRAPIPWGGRAARDARASLLPRCATSPFLFFIPHFHFAFPFQFLFLFLSSIQPCKFN